MSPAAHAAVGAAIGGRIPRLVIAIPVAFASHFVLDAIPHFELFFPLAHWLGVSHAAAFWIVAVVCGIAVAPALLWITWRNSPGITYAAYCVVLTAFLIGYQSPGWHRLAGVLAVTGAFGLIGRTGQFWRWLACGLVTVLPDVLRGFWSSLDWLHTWAHFRAGHDLGWLFYGWFDGIQQVSVAHRFENWSYMSGYLLEIALELAIFLAGLYLTVRFRPREQVQLAPLPAARKRSAADLTAVHYERSASDERGVV